MDVPVTFKNINTLITVTTATPRASCDIKAIRGIYDGEDRKSHWKQEFSFLSLNICYCVKAGWTLLTMLVIITNWWLPLELRNTQQTPESPNKKGFKKGTQKSLNPTRFQIWQIRSLPYAKAATLKAMRFYQCKTSERGWKPLTHLISTLCQGASDQSSQIFGCSCEPFAALASRWHGAYCGLHTSCWWQCTPTTLPGIQSNEKGKRLYL